MKFEKLGTGHGGWVVPVDLINADTVCYCGGVGEDISFDLTLIERFGCTVHALGPTPRAITFVEKTAPLEKFQFCPWGLSDEETTLKYFEPAAPPHVSHSVVNLQGTDRYFEASCKPVSSIAEDLGHTKIGLIKIDTARSRVRGDRRHYSAWHNTGRYVCGFRSALFAAASILGDEGACGSRA